MNGETSPLFAVEVMMVATTVLAGVAPTKPRSFFATIASAISERHIAAPESRSTSTIASVHGKLVFIIHSKGHSLTIRKS
jgi:hypothetical protein